MKQLQFISILFMAFLCSCREQKKPVLSNDVMILTYPKNDRGTNFQPKDSLSAIRFSPEFWDYFKSSHPRITLTIFAIHLYREHNLELADTSYSYYDLIYSGSFEVGSLPLADSAGGIEKQNRGGGIWKYDSTGKPLPYRPVGRTLSENLAKQYYLFKRLALDTSFRHIIIYKKAFGESYLSELQSKK